MAACFAFAPIAGATEPRAGDSRAGDFRASAAEPQDSEFQVSEFQLHPVELVYDKKPGIWFAANEAAFVLERLELLDKFEEQVANLESLAANLREQRDAATALANEHAKLAAVQKTRADLLQEELDDSNHWLNHPGVWLSIGAAVAVIVTIVVGAQTSPIAVVR